MKHNIFLAIILTLALFSLANAQIKAGWEFKDELISYMQSPKDTIFIQDRKKLERVGGLKCNDSIAYFTYKSRLSDSLLITIESARFIPSNHTIYLGDTVFKYIHNVKRIDYFIERNLIDGRPAFGNNSLHPEKEIKSIKIKWGATVLNIPDSAFHNLYEAHLCLTYLPVEAYITGNNKYLYLYISASDGAGSYGVKFVFDKKKYLTRIVNRNECSDHFNFLDATEGCEN